MALLRLTRSGGAAAAIANSDRLRRLLCSFAADFSPHYITHLLQPRISLSTATSPSSPSLDEHFCHRPLLLNSGEAELQKILDLISQARRDSSSREEAAASLRSSGEDLAGDLLSATIWELREDWESALLAFQWGAGEGKCRLSCNLRSWHLIVWILARNKKFAIAWFLLRKMRRLSILSHPPFIVLMEGYAAANEPRMAIKTFRAIEKLGLAADSSSFYDLLRSLCKHKNVEEAEDLFLSNSKMFPLTVEGFNIILEGWCIAMAEVAEAKRWWREMAARCVVPDEKSYALMIERFAMEGNLFDSMRLYDEMKRKGLIPPLQVYNSLIYAMAREGLIVEAKKLLNKAEEKGLRISAESYNSLICPLCEAKKVNEARETMETMIRKGIYPNSATYRAFAGAEAMEGTMSLLRRMKEEGSGPDGSIFIIIMEKFFAWNQAENALRIWAEMKNHGVEGEAAHYLAVVRGLVSCGWKPKAMEFYCEMKARGFRSDPKLERMFREEVAGGRGRAARQRRIC